MGSLLSFLRDQPRDQHYATKTFEPFIEDSITYLNSADALKSIRIEPYYPKWNSPWWHMSVLFEMGMPNRIPKTTASLLLSEIKATHLNYFFKEDAPSDQKENQGSPCPCAFGNIYQILTATGLDVDASLPWARDWFLKYQMPDGGLSCDEDAYHADAGASSMVGTIAPLEAILSVKTLSAPETLFLARGAEFMLKRELRLGSLSKFNAEEKLDEEDWLKPCFPRFYFYDVLRGLNFILNWADRFQKPLPENAILPVVKHLSQEFPRGGIELRRFSFEGTQTRLSDESGKWIHRQNATHFPLLDQTSALERESPFLSAKWQEALGKMDRLSDRGLWI